MWQLLRGCFYKESGHLIKLFGEFSKILHLKRREICLSMSLDILNIAKNTIYLVHICHSFLELNEY